MDFGRINSNVSQAVVERSLGGNSFAFNLHLQEQFRNELADLVKKQTSFEGLTVA